MGRKQEMRTLSSRQGEKSMKHGVFYLWQKHDSTIRMTLNLPSFGMTI